MIWQPLKTCAKIFLLNDTQRFPILLQIHRSQITVVLAMTADGKISDYQRSPARFGSARDKTHLEAQIAQVDGVMFGAGTLRAYRTTLRVSNPEHLREREEQGKPLQPIQIVCSASGNFDPNLPFFSQPVPRWLLTNNAALRIWQKQHPQAFERILIHDIHSPLAPVDREDSPKLAVAESESSPLPRVDLPACGSPLDRSWGLNWKAALPELWELGIHKLAVLGGGHLIGSLLTEDIIDDLWLTICPYLVGGQTATTAIAGHGLLLSQAKPLQLLDVKTIGQELFLHYTCR
jgi:riboflavin biosynthesis pyrimidine reductase